MFIFRPNMFIFRPNMFIVRPNMCKLSLDQIYVFVATELILLDSLLQEIFIFKMQNAGSMVGQWK